MPSPPSFFARRALVILMGMMFLLPWTLMGTRRALLSNRNDVRDWLPEDFDETATHRWFQKHFPHERFILVSWDGCTLDDPRLELFARKLERKDRKADEPWLFRHVLTGQRLVQDLQSRYEDLTEEEVLRRLEGSLIGPDHTRTCLVVTLAPETRHEDLAPALRKIREIAGQCGVPGHARAGIAGDEIRLGGPPVDNVAIDVEGQRTLFRLAGLSAVIGLGISWFCFRSTRLTLLVFWFAIIAAGLAVASVYWANFVATSTGLVRGDWVYGAVDAVLLSMPSLVFVLALSGSIHIVNYYHDAIQEKAGLDGAPDRAIRHAWYPCTVAALTTALGLGSLVASHVVPISKFGVYSAWGVMLTLVVLFLFLPSMLHFFPSREYARLYAGHEHVGEKDNRFIRVWRRIGAAIIRRNVWVASGCTAVMVVFALGVYRVETSVKLMKLFSPDAEIVQHYAWLEEQLGPLVPMEVVVRIDNQTCRLSTVERMRLVQQVEEAVQTLPDVGGALSAATFAPPLPEGGGFLGIEQRTWNVLLNRNRDRLREYLALDPDREESRSEAARAGRPLPPPANPGLEEMGISGPAAAALRARKLGDLRAILDDAGQQPVEDRLRAVRGLSPHQAAEAAEAVQAWRAAHGEELWRISARVAALGNLDYGHFVEDIRGVVEPVLDTYRAAGHDGVRATYTGLVPLVYKTQHELMRGLFSSLEYAFVLIAVVMVVVLKSPSAGLLAMVPNLFPVVVIFGFMGWTGILVDIGSMMTASVALGVAVDDTIHYLTWYRAGLDRGLDRKAAAMEAYERCATAMTQTTLIAGLGLAAFCFSTFTPTQRFGTLMLTILFAALVGDLVFLPALLTGPLGRLFGGEKKRPETGPSPSDAERSEFPSPNRVPEDHPDGDGHASVPTATPHMRRDPAHQAVRAP